MQTKPSISILCVTCVLLLIALAPACDDSDPAPDAGSTMADASSAPDAASPTPDAGNPDPGCRSHTECTEPGELCAGPNDLACGIPPQEECNTDQDCADGSVCHAIADSCSADRVGSRCDAPCTAENGCDTGFRCGPGNACEPIPCDDLEFQCRPSELCEPTPAQPGTPVHQIAHGCATIACENDQPCPDQTTCVNGYCQDGPGTCMPPVP